MSFNYLFEVVKNLVKWTDEELAIERVEIETELKDDVDNDELQQELQVIVGEQEKRKGAPQKTILGRRFSFKPYTIGQLEKFAKLANEDPSQLSQVLHINPPLSELEKTQALIDMLDRIAELDLEGPVDEPKPEELEQIEKGGADVIDPMDDEYELDTKRDLPAWQKKKYKLEQEEENESKKGDV